MPFFFLSNLNDERNLPAFFDVLLARGNALQTPEKRKSFSQDLLNWNTQHDGKLLMLAVKFGHIDFLVAFIEMGHHHNYLEAMLLCAAEYGHVDMIKLLIETYGALSRPYSAYKNHATFSRKLKAAVGKNPNQDVNTLCTRNELWRLHQTYVDNTALLPLVIPTHRTIDLNFLYYLSQNQLYKFFDRLVKAYNNPATKAKTLFYIQHKNLEQQLEHLAVRCGHLTAIGSFLHSSYAIDNMGNTAAFALNDAVLKLLITDHGLKLSYVEKWNHITKKTYDAEEKIKKIAAVQAEYKTLHLQYKLKPFKHCAMDAIRTNTPLFAPGIAELIGEYYTLSKEELTELTNKHLLFCLSTPYMDSLAQYNAIIPMLPLLHQRKVTQDQLTPFLQGAISENLLYDIVQSLSQAKIKVCPQALQPIITRGIEDKRPPPSQAFLLWAGFIVSIAMHMVAFAICCLTLPFLLWAAPTLLLVILLSLLCIYAVSDVVFTTVFVAPPCIKESNRKPAAYDLNDLDKLSSNLKSIFISFLYGKDTLMAAILINIVNCPLLIAAIILTFTVALPPVALGIGIGLTATTGLAMVSGAAAGGFFGYKYHKNKVLERTAIAEIDTVLRTDATACIAYGMQ